MALDLELLDFHAGVNPNKASTFELALGFMNIVDGVKTNFYRGNSSLTPNLIEFDYFWDSGFGATVSPVLISSNNEYSDGGFTFPLEVTTNALYHVTMLYTADDHTLRTTITSNGVPLGPVKDCTLNTNFSDFSVDHFGVSSYSDAGQFPGFEGSVLAHGVVDNFLFAAPPPVTKIKVVNESGSANVQFRATTNWLYILERATNLQTWNALAAAIPGISGTMQLQDTNPPTANAFYRVHAEYP